MLVAVIFTNCKQKDINETHDKERSITSYVNPLIGTDGHGHTFPGAAVPFGMVQLSPDTDTKGWDWCAGYHYSDSSIMGFSHTHLSGTGRGDLLDILLIPTVGRLKTNPGEKNVPGSGYRSRFSHSEEEASPGFYSVKLKDYNIKAELTCSKRVGFHRYTFPETDSAHVILDLAHGRTDDIVTYSKIRFLDLQTIVGERFTKGWGEPGEEYFTNQKVFFVAKFSKPFDEHGIVNKEMMNLGSDSAVGNSLKAFITYRSIQKDEVVLVKVAISSVDIQGAMTNLEKEIDHWDFDAVKTEANKSWEQELGKVKITDKDIAKKETFYTALYHSFLSPYLYMDADRRYRGGDDKIHSATDFTNFTFFSLWDTFRAAHPLYTILQKDKVNDMINSMLAHYDEQGLLPVWTLYSSETNCMIGYHSVPVIVDAYFKGIRNFDTEKAYQAMKASAMQDDFGVKYLKDFNYIPTDLHNKSVSKTLEYAFDDWCIARMAKALGHEDDYKYFMNRSTAFKNVFDKKLLFMRGKSSNGKFSNDFDPTYSSYGKSDFIEGNSWQYSWFVPHDVDGLIELMGGKEPFANKLDQLFNQDTAITEGAPLDISGLIGQYAHGNEPSHHVAYLYNYADQPYKTQQKVNQIVTTLYDNTPSGLSGNEDAGQMSAWYVFSALGFYPVNPASGEYQIGTPLFEEAEIRLENEKKFLIRANNLSKQNIYIKSVSLNGTPLNDLKIRHSDIMDGGKMIFEMTAEF